MVPALYAAGDWHSGTLLNVDLLVTAALAEEALGRWDPAFQHLAKAATLDPRSANAARRTGFALLWLRRYVPTA